MDHRVEHITDLGLVNYVQHPTNSKYIVYRFADKVRADDFEKALKEYGVWFEKSQEEGRTRMFYLYAIHRKNYKTVQSLNYAVEGKHRTFIVKNVFFRWFLVLFTIGITVLAFVGYCKNPEKVKAKTSYSIDNTKTVTPSLILFDEKL